MSEHICRQAYGPGPEGTQCGNCVHFIINLWSAGEHKCELRKLSNGKATNHKANRPTCGRFEEGDVKVHYGPKWHEKHPGQDAQKASTGDEVASAPEYQQYEERVWQEVEQRWPEIKKLAKEAEREPHSITYEQSLELPHDKALRLDTDEQIARARELVAKHPRTFQVAVVDKGDWGQPTMLFFDAEGDEIDHVAGWIRTGEGAGPGGNAS